MLNIGRMAPGSHDYYLGIVADGAEDYYLARGEEPGRWLGQGSSGLGLERRVEPEQLRRVLAGANPHNGDRLATHPTRRIPGFDLTFRAPKSVSLLWALADRNVAAQVAAAHDAAVDAAVGYLERAAGYTRRGAGGIERVQVEGFVATGFRHRTSRANDPLLHTHVLVANLARTIDDGIWRTLDSKSLYAHARTAGFVYQAHLRHELTRSLGVGWGQVVNGYADVAEVPRAWIDHFSQRRTQILEQLQARGERSAKAAQVTTLATRQPKYLQASEAELRAAWWRRARALGIDRTWPDRLLHKASPQRADALGLYRDLVSSEGLTGHASTFTHRDVMRAVAERLPTGAPVETIEQLADAIISHDPDQVIALGPSRGQLTALDAIRRADGAIVPADADEPRYTTPGLLLAEQTAIDRALGRLNEGVATVHVAKVDKAIGRRNLSDDQAAMVRHLPTSGHGVEVVVGKAGTGKSYALDAARNAWVSAGIPVTGVALAARAALELQDASGISSTTLARLLARLDDPRKVGSPLQSGSVLVVDEAGMVGTRSLARLLDHAQQQRVKVVLVGDPHQLPEINAGGLFRALATRLPAVELTHNRRQAQPWEADALDQLRTGDPAQAIATYREHGRIVTADTAEAVRERLVSDWWHTYDQLGSTSAVMVALRRAHVDDLNARARTRLLAAGHLTGPALDLDGAAFQAGDRIVCLRNNRRLGVVNGTRATVEAVDSDALALTVTTDDGRHLTLPARYLEAGWVIHGYAITGHKAQGLTVDHTFVLGSEELYREWGYVALSRGRHTNRLYLCDSGEDELHHDVSDRDDQVASLAARLQRSRAHQPVSDEYTHHLTARWRQLRDRLHATDITRHQQLTETRARLVADREHIEQQLVRLEGRIDRDRGGLGRWRNRHELADLDRDRQVRSRWLERIEAGIRQVDTELSDLPNQRQIAQLRDEYRDLTIRLQRTAAQRVAGFQRACPPYLATAVGTPPTQRRLREAWQQAALAVEQYRLRWNVTDPVRPLGAEPVDRPQQEDHRWAAMQIRRTRHELDREPTRERSPGLGMGISR